MDTRRRRRRGSQRVASSPRQDSTSPRVLPRRRGLSANMAALTKYFTHIVPSQPCIRPAFALTFNFKGNQIERDEKLNLLNLRLISSSKNMKMTGREDPSSSLFHESRRFSRRIVDGMVNKGAARLGRQFIYGDVI